MNELTPYTIKTVLVIDTPPDAGLVRELQRRLAEEVEKADALPAHIIEESKPTSLPYGIQPRMIFS